VIVPVGPTDAGGHEPGGVAPAISAWDGLVEPDVHAPGIAVPTMLPAQLPVLKSTRPRQDPEAAPHVQAEHPRVSSAPPWTTDRSVKRPLVGHGSSPSR
jgi:hypothetical protein